MKHAEITLAGTHISTADTKLDPKSYNEQFFKYKLNNFFENMTI